jgi:hypothetical protein
MKSFATAFCLAALLTSLPAQESPGAHLDIQFVGPQVEFHVSGPASPFLGGVILSLSPNLTHYFVDLPPILSDFVVLGVGLSAKSEYLLSIPQRMLPPGIMLYAQGLTADGVSLFSSDVHGLVLDGGPPQ